MAEAWSREESAIPCSAITPGFFKNTLTATLFKSEKTTTALANQTLIGRNGLPKGLADLTLFLASPASGYITGQTIFLDGGLVGRQMTRAARPVPPHGPAHRGLLDIETF
jgi:NAD(P)-dependent dehydrogenase (short-subunit alcohol dehydrogenase family)